VNEVILAEPGTEVNIGEEVQKSRFLVPRLLGSSLVPRLLPGNALSSRLCHAIAHPALLTVH
jgi:hypothetical protein